MCTERKAVHNVAYRVHTYCEQKYLSHCTDMYTLYKRVQAQQFTMHRTKRTHSGSRYLNSIVQTCTHCTNMYTLHKRVQSAQQFTMHRTKCTHSAAGIKSHCRTCTHRENICPTVHAYTHCTNIYPTVHAYTHHKNMYPTVHTFTHCTNTYPTVHAYTHCTNMYTLHKCVQSAQQFTMHRTKCTHSGTLIPLSHCTNVHTLHKHLHTIQTCTERAAVHNAPYKVHTLWQQIPLFHCTTVYTLHKHVHTAQTCTVPTAIHNAPYKVHTLYLCVRESAPTNKSDMPLCQQI